MMPLPVLNVEIATAAMMATLMILQDSTRLSSPIFHEKRMSLTCQEAQRIAASKARDLSWHLGAAEKFRQGREGLERRLARFA